MNRLLLATFALALTVSGCVVHMNYRTIDDFSIRNKMKSSVDYKLDCHPMDGDRLSGYFVIMTMKNFGSTSKFFKLRNFSAKTPGQHFSPYRWTYNFTKEWWWTKLPKEQESVELPPGKTMYFQIFFKGLRKESFEFFVRRKGQEIDYRATCQWSPLAP